MSPRYLTYQEIDKQKWDACIDHAGNGLIYGYSFYLDHMSKHWDALVLNDYEAVMPLTWNRKYSISYLYQPAFTASLGVFGRTVNASLLSDFLNAVPAKFSYWDICLNEGNCFPAAGYNIYERVNYILPLSGLYTSIFSSYRESTQRNIKKAVQLNCVIKKDIEVSEVIRLSKEQSLPATSPAVPDFDHIRELYKLLRRQQKAESYGVYSNGMLVASAVFFFSHKRAYYILVGNHPNSKATGASHMLIDAFIKDHAGKDLVLDFEGSDIRNLAFFYSSFGASAHKYAALRVNRLPAILKWMKKN